MEELGRVLRGRLDDRAVDAVPDRDRAHRLRAIGQRLGHRDDVRQHAEGIRRERLAGAPEAADHFVEFQQYAVTVADLADALEVTLRRHDDAGRTGNRLYEHGRDALLADEVHESLQI